MKENFLNFVIWLQSAYRDLLGDVAVYAWKALLAVALVAVGFYIVKFVQETVEELVKKINLDKALRQIDFDKLVERTGNKLDCKISSRC